MKPGRRVPDPADPLWFKDAVIYELHVRAFYDSDADGMGDFRGLARKLDYLADLGVTALWLLPFCPSPWRDDGYDISDYTGVHPAYGTLKDFQSVLRKAHERGLKVITELVLNHTSDQHPWFQRARRARPGTKWRDFYVWSDSAERFADARIIFKDFETSNWAWDPVAKAYYWHRFYSHQPDLNYDSPEVRRAMFAAVDFWFELGVDGLRLDAVPYLYEREGTHCENLPETHGFLQELRRHIDSRYSARLLLAEANQWPEDAVSYFGKGDECHMAFHFPLMPRLFMAQRREDRFPIVDILEQTPAIPDSCQWGLFLRNHDELTLEMVTDEERDFMYRVYARDPKMRLNLGIRRRLAPLLGNNRRRYELMHGLLFSLPGTPIIYYGDEIGMGDNIYLGDRNGVRTPMQWSIDRNAGFSKANPQQLYLPIIIDPEYHYEAVNVESEQGNPHSILWWMKRLIALRKRSRALSRGSLQMLQPDNHRILAFVREFSGERVLVVANLSRFSQPAQLDLSPFPGTVPIEMFGGVRFPPVSDGRYCLTLAPHSFYWFRLESARSGTEQVRDRPFEFPGNIEDASREELQPLLLAFLQIQPWFDAREVGLRSLTVRDRFVIGDGIVAMTIAEYVDAEPDLRLVALALGSASGRDSLEGSLPVRAGGGEAISVAYDALASPRFCRTLEDLFETRQKLRGIEGELVPVLEKEPERGAPASGPDLQARQPGRSPLVCGDRFVVRLLRTLEPGPAVDIEITGKLQRQAQFRSFPELAGSIEYRVRGGDALTAAVVHRLVPNNGTAWEHTMDALGRFFDRALARGVRGDLPAGPFWQTAKLEVSAHAAELMGNYLEDARLLGERTAQMHTALASFRDDPDFAPEPFSEFYRVGLYHAFLGGATRTLHALRQHVAELTGRDRELAVRLLSGEGAIRDQYRTLRNMKATSLRMRVHGDYRLERLLWTGSDYVVFGFEGEPGKPKAERRAKRSCLRDLAGMLLSLRRAAAAAPSGMIPGVLSAGSTVSSLEHWSRFWRCWTEAVFVRGYLDAAGSADFLPAGRAEFEALLRIYLLDRSLSDLRNELAVPAGRLADCLATVSETLPLPPE
jgi:maltose alpha-D-glucosyltransferase / alpha-amylase